MNKRLISASVTLIIILAAFIGRTIYGLSVNFSEGNTQYLQDYTQIYLIGLKFYITKIWPFWGPDITYTFSQIPGGLQGLLVGLPFYLFEIPEAPFIILNGLSMLGLLFFAWYFTDKFPGIPKWFMYAWLLTAPWTLNFSTTVINPSYLLTPAIFFFIAVIEMLPIYKKKTFSTNMSSFILGFTLGWIMQLHMSWVLLPFYLLLVLIVLIKTKKIKIIIQAAACFLLGLFLILLTLIPTFYVYGFVTGGAESTIVVNFLNLKNIDIITRFIALSTFEAGHFITGGIQGARVLLANNLWAVPVFIFLFITGIAQTIWYFTFFFKKTEHEEFHHVKKITIGTIILVFISYLFAVRDVSSHTFYLLLPVSFWFSFYCTEPLFKKLFWRYFAVIVLLSGLIYHVILAKEYAPLYSLNTKKDKIENALLNKDSRIFAFRRVAEWEQNERRKFWVLSPVEKTNHRSIAYTNMFDFYPENILPETLINDNYYSAPYSLRVDSANPYSIGLNIPIRDLMNKRKLLVSFYARYDHVNDAVLTVSIDHNKKSIFWTGDRICEDQMQSGKWHQVTIRQEIPGNINSSAKLTICVWLPNAGKTTSVLLDNFKITVE